MGGKDIKDKRLSDTDKELIALGAKIEREIREDDSDERRRTPSSSFPVAGESSEQLRLLIRDEITTHSGRCEKMKQMEKRMDKTEAKQQEAEAFINQYLGEKRFVRYVMPLVIGVVSSSAAAAVLAMLFRGLMQGARHP